MHDLFIKNLKHFYYHRTIYYGPGEMLFSIYSTA